MSAQWKNKLYFGDNLDILRESITSESIDLIYLDPPFNSKANYNLLFKSPKGHESHAQITAFEDTWHWGEQAEKEFTQLIHQPNTDVSEMMQALRRFLGENDMMAYLTMMANRLLELHRILKTTGSLYLHCDPTAAHYLKIVLDGVFGKEMFRNEIVWKRTHAHGDSRLRLANVKDSIFFYGKTDKHNFKMQHMGYPQAYIDKYYRYTDADGRKYQLVSLRSPNPRPNLTYEYKGVQPHKNGWAVSREKMGQLDREGRLRFPDKPDQTIREKYYLDEMRGVPLTDLWDDISPINSQAQERLGYPTQKPLALLERIISASSNEGDVVLDPFCGCGTAIHAAQKLQRKWVGIDITHLAISLVEKRLKDAFPDITFEVHGVPKDFDSARDLAHRDKYQFQWWACSLVNAQPYQGRKKGADTGIDGLIFFQDDKTMAKKIIVSVKGGETVSVPMIRDLGHVVDREKAVMGFFVTLAEPTRPMREEAIKVGYYESATGASFPKIQILTVKGLLDGTERPNYPDLMRGGLMFNKAKREQTDKQHDLFGARYAGPLDRSELPQAAEAAEPFVEPEPEDE
jgi:site-specific DNA-methyltransferase (adenine-specific)